MRPFFIFSVVMCALCMQHPLCAQNPAAGSSDKSTDSRAALRGIYDEHIDRLAGEHDERLASLSATYLQQLKQLATRFQSNGDLEGWRAVEAEMTRFKESPEPLSTPPENTRRALAMVQNHLADGWRKAELNHAQQLLDLTGKYTSRLDQHRKDSTRAGDMEQAIAFDTEIKSVRNSAAIQAARFLVAEEEAGRATSEMPLETPAPGSESGGDPDPLPADQSEVMPWYIVDRPVQLFAEGAELSKCMVFAAHQEGDASWKCRPHRLRTAEATRRIRSAAIEILHGEKQGTAVNDDAKRKKEHGDFSLTPRQHRLWIFLRRITLSPLENPTVVVQVFAQNRDRRGETSLREVFLDRLPLPELPPDSMTVVTPPIHLTHYAPPSWAFKNRNPSPYGDFYYGAIVSVFSQEGKLLYQCSTERELDEFLPSSIPVATPAEEAHRRLAAAEEMLREATATSEQTPDDLELRADVFRARQRVQNIQQELSRLKRKP